jgi:hypothetical protein
VTFLKGTSAQVGQKTRSGAESNPTSTECSMLVMGIKSIERRAEIYPASPRSCSTADRVLASPWARGGCLIQTSIFFDGLAPNKVRTESRHSYRVRVRSRFTKKPGALRNGRSFMFSAYSPECECSAFWICSFTASMLKLAPFCIGGNSIRVWAALATSCCTKTKRQNSYTNQL